jgi:hypothetical protein
MASNASAVVTTTEADIPVWWDLIQDSGIQEDIAPDQVTAVKRYAVEWEHRWAFFQAIVGRVVDSGGIKRVIPLVYPAVPWLFARRIHCQPWGIVDRPIAGRENYKYAYCDVTFENVPWNFNGPDQPNNNGVYRSVSCEMTGEMLSLPQSALHFYNKPDMKVQHGAGMVVPGVAISVVQEYCPSIPFDMIFALVGCANSKPFYGARPGTCLFLGANSETQFGMGDLFTQQVLSQKLTMKFQMRPIPWNMHMRQDGVWDYVEVGARGSKQSIYPIGDLNYLFYDVDSSSFDPDQYPYNPRVPAGGLLDGIV